MCRMINESGVGETCGSCEGHILAERYELSEGVDPAVYFYVHDRERAIRMIPDLLAIKGDGYHCDVRWEDGNNSAEMLIDLNVYRYHNFYNPPNPRHIERRRALERAKAHLATVIRDHLEPGAPIIACPARRCIFHREENQADTRFRYSPEYTCANPSVAKDALRVFAASQTCAPRCPFYRRHPSTPPVEEEAP